MERRDFWWQKGKIPLKQRMGRLPRDRFLRDPDAVAEVWINKLKDLVYLGMPQGAPTSPLLSTIVLKRILLESKLLIGRIVMYADDGIIYGTKLGVRLEKALKFPELSGIMTEWSKSQWIKRDGVWLRTLRFLGLEYDPETDQLRARTRNGSELLFDKQELMEAVNIRDRGGALAWEAGEYSDSELTRDTWETWLKSKIQGYITARLYAGSWDLKDLQQDFSMTFGKNT